MGYQVGSKWWEDNRVRCFMARPPKGIRSPKKKIQEEGNGHGIAELLVGVIWNGIRRQLSSSFGEGAESRRRLLLKNFFILI